MPGRSLLFWTIFTSAVTRGFRAMSSGEIYGRVAEGSRKQPCWPFHRRRWKGQHGCFLEPSATLPYISPDDIARKPLVTALVKIVQNNKDRPGIWRGGKCHW